MDRYTELFLEEAGEHIETLNQVLLQMEREGGQAELIDEVFRIAHTLKSSAAFVGLEHLAAAAHHMEDLLQQLREGARELDGNVLAILFRCLDRISATVNRVAQGEPAQDHFADLIADLKQARAQGQKGKSEATPTSGTEAERPASASPNASPPTGPADVSAPQPPADSSGDATVPPTAEERWLTPEEERRLQTTAGTRPAYDGEVILDPDSPMRNIRFLLLMENLRKLGELFWCSPSEADLDAGSSADRFRFVLISETSRTELAKACRIDMVQEVIISEHQSAAGTTAGAVLKAGEETRVQTKNIKVSADKIDYLMNNVGEMVITNSGLLKIYEDLERDLGEDSALSELKSRIDGAARIARDLQTGIMKMRMIPVGLVFHRFTRPVRDLAAELGKEVRLVFQGDDTELDKNIIDALPDPLLHVLRNALDHGIEPAAERTAAGKPPQAQLTLSAYQGGNNIFIEVKDDGRGLNTTRILERAKSAGLAAADYRPASEEEVFEFIFQPGFSTAEAVSDISGRGVGMNVVKTMVQKFNGQVRIRSELGQGTSFLLSFPLTLAIISAILIRVGEEDYAVPLSDVIENLRIRRDEITRLEGRTIYNLRGEILPIHDLAALLGSGTGKSDHATEVPVLVANVGDRKHGFVVRGFAGKKEIVIKSLEQNYRNVRGLIGVCLMGDGRIVPVLDVQGLLAVAYGEEAPAHPTNVAAVSEYNDGVQVLEERRAGVGARRSIRERLRLAAGVGSPGPAGGTTTLLERDIEPVVRPEPTASDLSEWESPATVEAASDTIAEVPPDSAESPEEELSAALARLHADREERRIEALAALSVADDLPQEIDRVAFDKLYEVINAGMMNAGLVLSQLLGVSIEVSVPEARVLDARQLAEFVPEKQVISVWLEGSGDLQLDLMLVFDERNGYAAAGELMGLPAEDWIAEKIPETDLESVLSELSNIVGSSIFNALANKSGLDSQPSVPDFLHATSQELMDRFLRKHELKDYRIIYISTDFYRTGMELVGRLFLFLPRASVALVSERL